MAKIRLQDLARTMGVPEQDLMFKLRSIGVRIEGDDAAIDSETMKAIVQGKRLPQPREVILRDDSGQAPAPPPSAPVTPQHQPSPLRPVRRKSMIQRVEKPIREIPTKEPPIGPPAAPGMEGRPAELEEAPVTAPTPAAVPAESGQPGSGQPELEKAARAAETPVAAEPAVEAPAPAAAQPPVGRAPAAKPAAGKPAAGKPAARPAPGRPAPGRPTPGRPAAGKPAPGRPTPGRPAPGRPAPGRPTPGRPAPGRPGAARPGPVRPGPARRRPPPRRPGMRRPGFRPSPPRGPIPRLKKTEPTPALKPASARGERRAQRRQETQDQPTTIRFKEDRPQGPVTITERMTVREFAEKLGIKAKDLIKTLIGHGILASINHELEPEMARTIAEELGVEAMEVTFEEEAQLQHETVATGDVEKAPRAPVVTVMGHVDHGKTTLLDAIRSTNVVAGEAGGITQHIGAYLVELADRKIVFLDTPGHEAFTMMRARGAKATDIVVLVVAADDGVMPQTLEAIDHAQAAEVPIVIAINKVDKANANLDRVKKELADRGLVVEDWGGDTVSVALSALRREGIEELLEMVLLTADLLELEAAPEMPAHGIILEARKEIGRGIIATMLVQEGTLAAGDVFVAGATWGRVRSMTSDRGERMSSAGPATPVEVTGFNDVPSAGDSFQVFADESKARHIAGFRSHEERQRELAPRPRKISLEALFSGEEEVKELPVIIKADVHGSVEVVRDTLQKLPADKVKLEVIRAAVGGISTNDVQLALASNAIIVGFNVRPERKAAAEAEKEQIEIRLHTVIYELVDELKLAMAGLLEPTLREVQRGSAEVRQTFKVPKIGTIAGCMVTEGNIPRNAEVRLVRDSRVVYEGKIGSLRRFKEDVSEVRTNFECGIGLDGFQDLKPGDVIEAFIREEVAATL